MLTSTCKSIAIGWVEAAAPAVLSCTSRVASFWAINVDVGLLEGAMQNRSRQDGWNTIKPRLCSHPASRCDLTACASPIASSMHGDQVMRGRCIKYLMPCQCCEPLQESSTFTSRCEQAAVSGNTASVVRDDPCRPTSEQPCLTRGRVHFSALDTVESGCNQGHLNEHQEAFRLWLAISRCQSAKNTSTLE